ncbi:bifunctional diguanylate cyclase/phosphodiesterase [Paraglaciecola sp. 20A4]|uniref:putative bifunctional diguanylate cyclase/phosphodiesterase n=1 Tax=Paraglaciecola sp. 20A4 TaxID=2687288 RepID=UPI00140C2693|nr:bifunctional diguanylate cyclase/phosphodiesterase [Paraglaciecola sp. 20A4]
MITSAFRDFRSRAILAFITCSILALISHRIGLMDVSLDLLSSNTLVDIENHDEGGMHSTLELNNHLITVACTFSVTSTFSLCNLKLKYSHNENIKQGIDLSDYQSFEIVASIKSPIEQTNIKLYFRNNNPAYSREDVAVSDKFNTIEFKLRDQVTTLEVPTKALFVAQWWKKERNIGYEQSHVDLSNIVLIELVIDDAKVPGDYLLTLHSIKMSGEIISEPDLLMLILFLLFVMIVLLTIRQKNSLKKISTTDQLTGLLNRRGMISKVNKEFKSTVAHHSMSLFYFDVDDFKKINDTYGHVVGDELLAAICQKVIGLLSEMHLNTQSSFARLAGDEFVLMITDCDNHKAVEFSRRIIDVLVDPLAVSGCEVKVGISLGLAYSNGEKITFQELMSRADSAMFCAKQQGKGQFKLFDDSLASAIYFKKTIAENLKNALLENEFTLRFMPIFTCSDLKPTRLEVLIRCESTAMKGITPDIFIPIAEDFGIIEQIDLWVIETTFDNINKHFLAVNRTPPICCINISAIELTNDSFPKQLEKLIEKYFIPPSLIELEITETCLIEADDTSFRILNELKKIGVSLALDDFGTGYTAFNQLINYPVDCLKIDRAFVADIDPNDPSKTTMVNAIVSIAKSYKLVTIGEGVETQEQLDYLRTISCDYVQGFYLSKPLLLDDLMTLLNKQ